MTGKLTLLTALLLSLATTTALAGGLGIPTSRSLAVVATGEPVYRETVLPGAVLTRVAASHLRVGTFEYAAARGDREELQLLADYCIARHYPALESVATPYPALLEAIIIRQAGLLVQWQLVGFIHGVMNTDNTALSGETIDYGPCAFMDAYDPATVFSSIDRHGRYAYANQPPIAQWNLARLALAEGRREGVRCSTGPAAPGRRFCDIWFEHAPGVLIVTSAWLGPEAEGEDPVAEAMLLQRLWAALSHRRAGRRSSA